MFKVLVVKKKSDFTEMKGNVWDFKEIDRIVKKIADKFLREFHLYSHHDSMRLIDKYDFFNKYQLVNKEGFYKDGFYYLFAQNVRPPGWLRNAKIFYRLWLKGMKPRALVDNEGRFLNATNGFINPEIKYHKRTKMLRIDNEPVLSLELTEKSLQIILGDLECFNELKKEIVKKLRTFCESVKKDKEINKKVFFLTPCKDYWSLKEIDPTISMGLFYSDTIRFRKGVFRKGIKKVSVCVGHYGHI